MGEQTAMSKKSRPKQQQTKPAVVRHHDGFTSFTNGLGLGADNVLTTAQYLTTSNLTSDRTQLDSMYRESWIIGAAIDAIADDMVRSGISIESSNTTTEIAQMQRKMTSLGLWRAINTGLKWGRLYGGAAALIMIEGQDVSTPLDVNTIMEGQFKGLRVFDRWSLMPSMSFIHDGGNDGLPEYYTVTDSTMSLSADQRTFHHSRVIRFTGIDLPVWDAVNEQMWGASVIERLQDRLIAFDSATMGAANLVNRAYLRTVRIDKLRDILAAGGEAEANLIKMFLMVRTMQRNEGLTLLDKEDEFDTHTYQFSGLSDIILQFGQQISGAIETPLVRLFGQSPAGLSSTGESDMRNYYDGILAKQEARLGEGIGLLLQILHQSMFKKRAPDDFGFTFVPLWQLTQEQMAEIAERKSKVIIEAFNSGVIKKSTALKELKAISVNTGVFTNITDEDIKGADGEDPPLPPAMVTALAPTLAPTKDSALSRTMRKLFGKKA
jgi:uncharacterized protein